MVWYLPRSDSSTSLLIYGGNGMAPAKCNTSANEKLSGCQLSSIMKLSVLRSTIFAKRMSSPVSNETFFSRVIPYFHLDAPPIKHFHNTVPCCDMPDVISEYFPAGSRQNTSITPPDGFWKSNLASTTRVLLNTIREFAGR